MLALIVVLSLLVCLMAGHKEDEALSQLSKGSNERPTEETNKGGRTTGISGNYDFTLVAEE